MSLTKNTWRAWGLVLALAAPVALTGCPSVRSQTVAPIVPGQTASALVGPEGATLDVGTLQLVIPPGALETPVEIRVTVEDSAVPGAFTGYSPVVRFEPEGTFFERPVEVRVPFDGDPALATIFWSQHEGSAYVPRPTRVADGYAIAEAGHFSRAFVGTACTGSSCCSAANGELDLLLVLDNSNSMVEEQALLRAQLPRIAEILATGDRDGDGVQDFPALASVHVGVTTTDLGAGPGASIPTCSSGWGDDGILRNAPTTPDASCSETFDKVARFDESNPTLLDRFTHQVDCVTRTGTNGCGFEQQLEASLIALSPSMPADWTAAGWALPTFLDGRPSHGDGANAGFLRPDSVLAVLQVTDEDDTSVSDPSLFSAGDPRFAATPLNLRGHTYADPSYGVVYPVSRYVDGLIGLRAHPANLIFAAVTGVPTDTIADAAEVDFDALAAHPLMTSTLDAAGTNLVPSCSSDNGTAYPPTRLVETARGLDARGAGTVLASICDPTFDALLDGLIERIARRAAGACH